MILSANRYMLHQIMFKAYSQSFVESELSIKLQEKKTYHLLMVFNEPKIEFGCEILGKGLSGFEFVI